jgi:hypothetical protein
MTEHRIGTQEERQAERDELLKEEKESPAAATSSRASGATLPRFQSRRTSTTSSTSCG